jgi:starch phosphorylase
MKQSMMKLAPVFNTHRMIQEYTEHFYLPAALRTMKLGANDHAGALELAAWKAKVWANWKDVKIGEVKFANGRVFQVGQDIAVEAVVQLGTLAPTDASVQIYVGALDSEGHIVSGETLQMEPAQQLEPGHHLYRCRVQCRRSGRQGFGVRVVPSHPDLVTPFDLSVMTWV